MAKHEFVWQIDVAKILGIIIVLGLLIVGYKQFDLTEKFDKLQSDLELKTGKIEGDIASINAQLSCQQKIPIKQECQLPIDCVLDNTLAGCSKLDCNYCCQTGMNQICTVMRCENATIN